MLGIVKNLKIPQNGHKKPPPLFKRGRNISIGLIRDRDCASPDIDLISI
jgi:hypothetical protein